MDEGKNTSFMMEYDDEAIVKHRRAAHEKKRLSIKNGIVNIEGTDYIFTRRGFPYGFSMVVPETFAEMPPEIAKQMFPYEDRPAIIISDSGFRVCIAFNCAELDGGGLGNKLPSFQGFIKRICPTSVFFLNGVYHLPNGLEVAHYDYRYPAVDNDLYDLTFFTDLPDMELLGWFLCPVELKDKWEPLIREMVQTIQVETGA